MAPTTKITTKKYFLNRVATAIKDAKLGAVSAAFFAFLDNIATEL